MNLTFTWCSELHHHKYQLWIGSDGVRLVAVGILGATLASLPLATLHDHISLWRQAHRSDRDRILLLYSCPSCRLGVLRPGRSCPRLDPARALPRTQLYKWRAQMERIDDGQGPPSNSPERDLRKEIRDLKRLLGEKTQEVAFSKLPCKK